MTKANLDGPFLRKVWKRLRDSPVPIVDDADYSNAEFIAEELSGSVDNHLYLPSNIHGYLGIQKGGGVTRFLPILTAKDMGVYYYLCYRLAPQILVSKKGIFGAWHSKPKVVKGDEEHAAAFGQGYGYDPFSSHWWLKEWKQFNDLIWELIKDPSVGKYVVTTDIANFYDSIEVPRLISRVRRAAPSEADTTDALNAFLSSWNRKHVGYMASTKGIPQEIISDASRILAHFYLQEFDEEFFDYCSSNNLTYVRWADDFLIFGGSKAKLQSAVHHASRLLRDVGLNLNASKTRYLSKSQLRSYRCLDIISAISHNDHGRVSSKLKLVKKSMVSGGNIRLDTVFRAMIGYMNRNEIARTVTNRSFLLDVSDFDRNYLHSLNNVQMLRYIQLMECPLEAFDSLKKDICKADFGGPKASYLHMMRKYRNQLASMGMTKAKAKSTISFIEKHSVDSEVITSHCVPLVRKQYS